jgi:hypothetical protein
MVVRTRSNCGKFISLKKTDDRDLRDQVEAMRMSKRWVYKIFLLLTFFIIVSPWVFLILKNNSLTLLTRIISDFYDDNFSCSRYRNEGNSTDFNGFSDFKNRIF